MAVRIPLFWDAASSSIKEMQPLQIAKIIERTAYLYGLNPSVQLNLVSEDGSLGILYDSRLIAGASVSNPTAFLGDLLTPAVTITQDQYSKVDLSTATVSVTPISDPDNISFPVYFDGNDIRAMSQQDFFDTFTYPAIDLLTVASTTNKTTAGTYTISTNSSLVNHTQIGLIYQDTTADISKYTQAGIPEALDQKIVVTSYYLHRRNAEDTAADQPLVINAGSHLNVCSKATFDTLLGVAVRYSAVNDTNGHKITYEYGTNSDPGLNRGTGIVDSRYDGQRYEQRRINADDYRSQKFPDGSINVSSPTHLKIRKA